MSGKTELQGNAMMGHEGEMGRFMSCALKPFPQLRESESGSTLNIKSLYTDVHLRWLRVSSVIFQSSQAAIFRLVSFRD
jgi:hypothetical protein